MQTLKTKVAVAGGGPVGKIVALSLARDGVDCVLIGRPSPGRHPKAHALTCRSMEIFRQLGVDADILRHNPPLGTWENFSYTRTLTGGCFGVQKHTDSRAFRDLCEFSTCRPAHVSQPYVEDALDAALMPFLQPGSGIPSPLTFLDSHDCRDASAGEWGTRVVAELISPTTSSTSGDPPAGGDPAPSAHSESFAVEAEHLVICDGANSSLRHGFGVNMEGPGCLQTFMSIHFFSAKLADALLAGGRSGWGSSASSPPPSMLYFVFNSSVIACVVSHSLARGEFVMQAPYYPKFQSPEDFQNPEVSLKLIRAAVGDAGIDDIKVHAAHPWMMAAQVAEAMQCGGEEGRVFIAGDAAHRFPPSGGLGLNTGVADAHNLAWKLSAVHRNGASAGHLLRSYDAERRPAAKHLVSTAVRCFRRGMKVPSLLGLHPSSVDTLGGAAESLLPASLSKTAFEWGLFGGRHLTYASRLQASKVQRSLDSDGIPLFFSKDDLGVGYSRVSRGMAATIPLEGAQRGGGAAAAAAGASFSYGIPDYTPAVLPGERMPAVPVVEALEEGSGGGGSAHLPFEMRGTAWRCVVPVVPDEGREAEGSAMQPTPTPVESTELPGPRKTACVSEAFKGYAFAGGAEVVLCTSDLAFPEVAAGWRVVCASLPNGDIPRAVLVRPDGHVAWVSPGGLPTEEEEGQGSSSSENGRTSPHVTPEEVDAALRVVLGVSPSAGSA